MGEPSLLIRGVRLAGPGEHPEGLVDVTVEHGRITAVELGDAGRPHGPVLDAEGRFLLPGLVDAHVHLTFDPDRHPESWLPDATAAEVEECVVENAAATLRAGVTTVRDLGSRGSAVRTVRDRIALGEIPGPRILAAGPVVTAPGGHCHYVGDAATAIEDLPRLVADHSSHGDPWLKVIVTGGALTTGSDPHRIQFDLEQVQRLVELAKEAGISTAAHVLCREGARIAIAAGVTTVEHGVDLGEEEVAEMRRRGQALVPVLAPSRLLLAHPEAQGTSPDHVAKLREVVAALHASTRRAVAAGVQLLVGTDAGCPAVPHGASVHHELEALEELGLSRSQSLRAATDPTPLTRGAGNEPFAIGSLADLILIDTDPLTDLTGLLQPYAVVARGRLAVGPR